MSLQFFGAFVRPGTWLAGIAAAAIAGSVAMAAEAQPPRDRSIDSSATAPQSLAAVADAPNARMVALVRAGGVVILSKGVTSVTRTQRGIYCILPDAATGIKPKTAVATVSVEYYYSKLNEVKVQWARRGHGCGVTRFGVYTLADPTATGLYQFSNAVGFVIYVP